MNYTVNKVGNTVATAACGSPWWLPTLHDLSATAAEWLPILGACYLVIQVGHFLWTKKWTRSSDTSNDE
jgi:hypothetical protein